VTRVNGLILRILAVRANLPPFFVLYQHDFNVRGDHDQSAPAEGTHYAVHR
jgi:hypothetical protein